MAPTSDTATAGQLEPLRDLERRHIERAMRAAGGNRLRAAAILGITRWSLARRLRKYRLQESMGGTTL